MRPLRKSVYSFQIPWDRKSAERFYEGAGGVSQDIVHCYAEFFIYEVIDPSWILQRVEEPDTEKPDVLTVYVGVESLQYLFTPGVPFEWEIRLWMCELLQERGLLTDKPVRSFVRYWYERCLRPVKKKFKSKQPTTALSNG